MLLDHPLVGASWEGFAIETLITCAPSWWAAAFYRTAGGAEIDLLLEPPGCRPWAIEIKRSLVPKVARGFHQACADLRPERRILVCAGTERLTIAGGVEVVPLGALARELAAG
jgi:predicted AAA+ superfamily ATPase